MQLTENGAGLLRVNQRLERLRRGTYAAASRSRGNTLRTESRGLLREMPVAPRTDGWSRMKEIREQVVVKKPTESPVRLVIWALFIAAMYVLSNGCAPANSRVDQELTMLEETHGTAAAQAAPATGGWGRAPGMLLFRGEENDYAESIGRLPWPSAYRDDFGGELGAYREVFLDIQGGFGGFGYGGYGYGGYTQRRFQSNRVGAYSR